MKLSTEIGSEKIKSILKRIWKFLIYDQSIWSYLADAVIIIIVGKFIILPVLGLFLGTPLPVVGVTSSSMDHYGKDFDSWWEENRDWYLERNINKEEFENFDFNNGFKKGSGLVLVGVDKKELCVGDVIVFSSPKGPIIHRIISKEPLQTKGDANSGQLAFEKEISEERIEGKAVVWIPLVGWPTAIVEDIKGIAK